MDGKHLVLIAGFTASQVLIAGQSTARRILAEEAKDHMGESATICGRVMSVHCSTLDRTTVFELGSAFSVTIEGADRLRFGDRVEDRYELTDVCVTGTIEKRAEKLTVVASHADQLTIERHRSAPSIGAGIDAYRVCDEGIQLPTPIRQPKPKYTREAERAKKQGNILLEAVVLTNGRVGEVQVLLSLDSQYGLDERAVKALKDWRFQPGSRNGRAVAVIVTVEMTFTLKSPSRVF